MRHGRGRAAAGTPGPRRATRTSLDQDGEANGLRLLPQSAVRLVVAVVAYDAKLMTAMCYRVKGAQRAAKAPREDGAPPWLVSGPGTTGTPDGSIISFDSLQTERKEKEEDEKQGWRQDCRCTLGPKTDGAGRALAPAKVPLRPHAANGRGRRADEAHAFGRAELGELRVLRQKAVAGVNALRKGAKSEAQARRRGDERQGTGAVLVAAAAALQER